MTASTTTELARLAVNGASTSRREAMSSAGCPAGGASQRPDLVGKGGRPEDKPDLCHEEEQQGNGSQRPWPLVREPQPLGRRAPQDQTGHPDGEQNGRKGGRGTVAVAVQHAERADGDPAHRDQACDRGAQRHQGAGEHEEPPGPPSVGGQDGSAGDRPSLDLPGKAGWRGGG